MRSLNRVQLKLVTPKNTSERRIFVFRKCTSENKKCASENTSGGGGADGLPLLVLVIRTWGGFVMLYYLISWPHQLGSEA